MVFSSVVFLFLFLPAIIFMYFLVPKKLRAVRNFIILIMSLAFYAWGEPRYIVLMFVSILINYVFGITVEKTQTNGKKKLSKWAFITCIVLNIGLLGYYKYFTFFQTSFINAFGLDEKVVEILLPIGISFYTFQGLSYVIDVWRREAPAQKNPLNIALYISLFPQLIAGPIVRYKTVADEIETRHENLDDFAYGARRFMFGFAKKMLLANTMGAVADEIFALNVTTLPLDLAWLGAITFQFQIYFDFSGYSDMAIGLGRMFGFHFLENFDYPLISKSVTEFWRRWHMSLGTWFRDYVYIPLGGNRTTPARHIFNILVVWALTGFWHGANWTFMAWGIYFAVFLILEKFFLKKILDKLPSFISHAYCLFLTTISWVIFNSPSLSSALTYIKRMFTLSPATDRFFYLVSQNALCLVVCVFASIPFAKFFNNLFSKIKNNALREFISNYPAGLLSALLFVLSIFYLINSTFNAFIYFRF